MKIFVCHSSQDKTAVEAIVLALRNLGHTVFFDRDALRPGEEYDRRIRSEVFTCDRFVFCLSAHSLRSGSYAQTELKFARERWEHPKRNVLTVVLDETPIGSIPPFLSAATLLRPVGNPAAEVAGHVAAVEETEQRVTRARLMAGGAALVATMVVVLAVVFDFGGAKSPNELAAERLRARLPERSGYTARVYPQFGFGFLAPRAWQVEDFAVPYGVPDIDLIQRYTDQKAAIGIQLNLLPVQPNYINDVEAEVRNQADVFRKQDPTLQVRDTTVGGMPAKLFKYTQGTGERTGDITRIWIRMAPEVKLQIVGFTYLDEGDRGEFAEEFKRLTESVVIDQQKLAEARSQSMASR